MFYISLLCFLFLVPVTESTHYKGGTITWKPTNPTANGSRIEILISEKHSWTLSRYQCNQNTINSRLSYSDTAGGLPDVTCYSSSSLCTASLYTQIYQYLLCTDFSSQLQSSSGAYFEKQNLSSTANIDIAYSGGNWADEIRTSSGTNGLAWYVGTHITLGTVYPINSSPG